MRLRAQTAKRLTTRPAMSAADEQVPDDTLVVVSENLITETGR
jgi:hypothetical protein